MKLMGKNGWSRCPLQWAALFCLASVCLAQGNPDVPLPDLTLQQANMMVAQADVIAVGTVVQSRGRTFIKVEKSLMGPAMNLIPVNVPAGDVTAGTAPPAWTPGGGAPTPLLQPNQNGLFVLQKSGSEFSIVWGRQGVRPVTDADRFAGVIERFPLSISLTAYPGICAFDEPVQVTALLRNQSDKTISVSNFALIGFFYSPRLGSRNIYAAEVRAPVAVPAGVDAPPGPPALAPPTAVELAPLKDATVTLRFSIKRPDSFAAFAPESLLLTPVGLRLQGTVRIPPPEALNFQLQSTWRNSWLGYPLPAELLPPREPAEVE